MPTVATIVSPVDFSDHSKLALAQTGAWARHFRAELIVVTLVEPLLVRAAAATYKMDLVRDEVLPELREFVGRNSVEGGPGMPTPEAIVLVGEPATEIVALARHQHADLIVIATHRLSGDYRKMLLRSTTENILCH